MRALILVVTIVVVFVIGLLTLFCTPTLADSIFSSGARYKFNPSGTSGNPLDSITMSDDAWIGLGPSAGRWIFKDETTDVLAAMTANVSVGHTLPVSVFDVGSTGDATAFSLHRIDPAINSGNFIGGIHFVGDDPTVGIIGAKIKGVADGAWVTNNPYTAITFESKIGGAYVENMRLASNGRLGLNTAVPEVHMELVHSASHALGITTHSNTEATESTIYLGKTDGTEGSEAAVDDNAVLGAIRFRGWDGDQWREGAVIKGIINGTPANNQMPTDLEIWTNTGGADPVRNVVVEEDGDLLVEQDIKDLTSTDVMYVGKAVIKTFGIAGSGLDFNFDADADVTEQTEDLGAILPAGCVIVSVVLECDETVTDGGDQSMTIDAGITTGTDGLLTAAATDSDGDTNVSASGSSPTLAHSTAARNVWINATPGVNWSTLTGGEWSIIIRYDDLGALRTDKGL